MLFFCKFFRKFLKMFLLFKIKCYFKERNKIFYYIRVYFYNLIFIDFSKDFGINLKYIIYRFYE